MFIPAFITCINMSLKFVFPCAKATEVTKDISSVDNQKGAINIQRCSAENQKGAIAVQSLWR